MKTRTITLTVAAILLIATVAMANSSLVLEPIFEDSTSFENITELSSDTILKFNGEKDFNFDLPIKVEIPTEHVEELPLHEIVAFSHFAEKSVSSLDSYIKTNDFAEIDQKRIKNKFINTITDYRMTSNELKFINSLIEDDYDIEKLLNIYEFLRWTDSDITMIPEIYLAGEENSDKKFWIYDAYDHILDRTDDMLSVEDVAYYVASGLTIDEIAGAYELSFAGVKTTKQMLNERLDGSTWNSISAEVISDEPQVIEHAPEMTINDVMKYRSHSVKMRKDVSDIITIENGAISLRDDVLSAMGDTLEIKQTFIKKFDAELPAEEHEPKTDYTTNSNATTFTNDADEYMFEEDYIPVEEPEVE